MRQRTKNTEPRPRAEEIPQDRIHLPVRWIVPQIDDTGAVDEEGTLSSYGESRHLIKEVADLCAAFHPTTQMHSFPRETPVFLFWQARSTGDWIITRVTDASDSELSTSLDYHCLVFDNNTFHALRFNPYRTRSLNLHDRLRTHVHERKTSTFSYTMPMSAVPDGRPVRKDADTSSESFDIARIAGLEADLLPSETNIRAIQEHCSRWQEHPEPPPTFATWWVNGNTGMESYFNVLLRVPEVKTPTMHEAKEAIFTLTTTLRLKLPNPSIDDLIALDLVQAILNDATGAENTISQAAAFMGVLPQQEFLSQTIGIKLHLGQLSTRINALVERLDDRFTEKQAEELHQLSDRCDEISRWIQAIRLQEEAESAPARAGKWALARLGWDKITWRSPFHLK